MSLKSTKLLKNALNALEQNDIHMLVWRGTSMARFLDGCKQSSTVVFWCPSDTLIAGKIRGIEVYPQIERSLQTDIISRP